MSADDWRFEFAEEPELIATPREAWLCILSAIALVVGWLGWAVFVISAAQPAALGLVAFPLFATGILLNVAFAWIRSQRNDYWLSPFALRRHPFLGWRRARIYSRRDAQFRSFAAAVRLVRARRADSRAQRPPKVSLPEDAQKPLPPPGEGFR